jgi:hypothetical protein
MSLDEYNSGDIVQLICKDGTIIEGILIKPDHHSNEQCIFQYILNETSGSTPTRILIESPNYKRSHNIITTLCDTYPCAFSFSPPFNQLTLISRYNNVSLLNITRQILNELI